MLDMLQPNEVVGLGVFVCALTFALVVCKELRSLHIYGDLAQTQVAVGIALSFVCAAWLATEATLHASRAIAAEKECLIRQGEERGDFEAGTANYGGAGGALLVASTGPTPLSHRLTRMLEPLRAGAELSGILLFMFLCDRTAVFGTMEKKESVPLFWAVWAAICAAAFFTIRELKQAKVLAREQTDEWRGWMQIMFLMYHYFHYADFYNAIRVFIAGYVMMTGFGNFMYYRGTDDFSLRRIMQMLFRLNFLGFCVCFALNNELMLYYICPMHTFFTILVILSLYIGRSLNQSTMGVYVKVALITLVTLLVYDGPEIIFSLVFDTVPVWKNVFAFHDPLHPEFTQDEMHEWHFRSGLDRFNWVVGMLIALHLPHLADILERLDAADAAVRRLSQCLLAVAMLAAGGVWVTQVFLLDKYVYNKVHPFTAFIPLVIFIVLRNLTATLRRYYIFAFAWIGQYTLETYILQFHVWMRTTGINGSPKSLIVFVPGSWAVNFVVGTTIYMFLSIRFFKLTVVLKDALIPKNNSWWPAAAVFMLGAGSYILSSVVPRTPAASGN